MRSWPKIFAVAATSTNWVVVAGGMPCSAGADPPGVAAKAGVADKATKAMHPTDVRRFGIFIDRYCSLNYGQPCVIHSSMIEARKTPPGVACCQIGSALWVNNGEQFLDDHRTK